MKKIICIAILCIACIFSLYGCSGKSDDNSQGAANNSNRGTVMGKIEAIDGNKITLALAEADGMTGGGERPSGDFSDFSGEMPEGFDPESFGGNIPENFNPESFFGGEMPEGFDPESFGGNIPENFNPESFFGGEMPEGFERPENGERPDMGEMPEGFSGMMGGMINFDASSLTYTGETDVFSIPEGMKIGDGNYTSLKVGDIIVITFDQEGGISEIFLPSAMKKPAGNTEETTA